MRQIVCDSQLRYKDKETGELVFGIKAIGEPLIYVSRSSKSDKTDLAKLAPVNADYMLTGSVFSYDNIFIFSVMFFIKAARYYPIKASRLSWHDIVKAYHQGQSVKRRSSGQVGKIIEIFPTQKRFVVLYANGCKGICKVPENYQLYESRDND